MKIVGNLKFPIRLLKTAFIFCTTTFNQSSNCMNRGPDHLLTQSCVKCSCAWSFALMAMLTVGHDKLSLKLAKVFIFFM